MKKYEYWLHCLPEIGNATIDRLLKQFGDEKNIYDACQREDEEFKKILRQIRLDDDKIAHVIKSGKSTDLDISYKAMVAAGIGFVTIHDNEYPSRLRNIAGRPYAIYYLGSLPEDGVPAVAVIGARNCSEYGRYVAGEFGRSLAKDGINVISGMALGVDGISQRGALEAGGQTYAVLGSGVDICYPPENRDIYERIPGNGGVISAFPPGSEPQKRFFPERNRIVAGLSDAVLVIEARQRSGTGITVSLALSMNRDVYAVPGRITDRLSDGCNMLISQGAGTALSPEDFVSEIRMLWNRKQGKPKPASRQNIDRPFKKLNVKTDKDNVTGILKYVDVRPLSVDSIHQKRLKDDPAVEISDTFSQLASLCIEGSIVQVGSGFFYRPFSCN